MEIPHFSSKEFFDVNKSGPFHDFLPNKSLMLHGHSAILRITAMLLRYWGPSFGCLHKTLLLVVSNIQNKWCFKRLNILPKHELSCTRICLIAICGLSLIYFVLIDSFLQWRTEWGGVGMFKHPPTFWRPSKIIPNSTQLWKLLKIAEFRMPTPQDVWQKGSKILKLTRFPIVLH